MNKSSLFKKVFSGVLTSALLTVSLFSGPLSVARPVAAANPKVEFTNIVDKAEANRGETLSYTLTAKNTGDTNLSTVFVWINQPNLADYVPGSSTYQHFNPAGALHPLTDAWVQNGQNFGDLPVGSSLVIKYQTKVASNANQDNILWSVASVTSDQLARVQANSWTRAVLKNPALCGQKTADKTSVQVGDIVTFTVKACNEGNIVLHNVYISDTINSPLEYIAGSTTLGATGEETKSIDDKWLRGGANIGPLNPGQSATLTFKVKVTDALKDGQVIQNTAQLQSDETPTPIQCPVILKGKVLAVTIEKPKELPNTGPGEMLLVVAGLAPAGWLLRKYRLRI